VTAEERPVELEAAITLFNRGSYLAAHECLDDLWEATEGADADFYKGLIQASIALHHFQSGNLDGAAKLYTGHRRFLAHYLPSHRGVAVAEFLADMQACLAPVLARAPDEEILFESERRPLLTVLPG